ncbi:MAG TPA: EAL domain-containing protein [Solirubrobacteraceae bacterium]|jgi:diguanylate cyclase (GGDEF)-like protein/PAS domain S-box-containing protein|nr:EAL domain-containing protein [Solirubrobacteraceae bacterium]
MTDTHADERPQEQNETTASRGIWAPYLALMALGTAGYALLGHSGLLFNLLGGLSVAALIAGAKLNAPRRRLPWYLLAIGQALFVTSDVLAYNYERLFGTALTFPSVADSFHLAFYPFFAGGLLLLIHERAEDRDRSALIDSLIVTLALATLLWVYLISPYANEATMSELGRLASIGYPAMDILVVGVLARLAAGCHRREASFNFMLCAIGALLLSDAFYGWRLLEEHFQPGPVTMTGWAVFYALLGTAAMHPSMRRLSEPGPESEAALTRPRLALLACAALTVPGVIVVRRALGEHIDLYVLVGASAAMFALVLLRMAGMVRRHEVLTGREAGLRIELAEQSMHRRSEDRLASLIKNSSDVVCILGADGRVRYLSDSVAPTLGLDPAELLGTDLLDVVHPDDAPRLRALIGALAAQPSGQPSLIEFRVRPGDAGGAPEAAAAAQAWRDVEAAACNLLADEAVEGIVLNMRDISERKAFQDELEHQAFHDTLTGLPNRALFRNRVEHALVGRRRDQRPVAVMFLDLDDFKYVNDSLGHAAGDEVLQEVARRIGDCMRPVDTAARLGGDEFAILLRDTESELHSIEVASRVMTALKAPIPLTGRDVTLAVSVGIAFSDQQMVSSADADELLRNADAAMYMAKEHGKDNYQLFNPEIHARALARMELKAELQRALEAGEFTLRYQPIMDLERGDMAGMEALARWEHPERGVLAPTEFVPLLEETGLIVPVGRHILGEACAWAARMQQECPREPPLSMAVNVSARQLQRPEFIGEVAEALEQTEIVPSSLTLELTESVMMQDMEVSLLRLEALRKLGVKLAIDDFGTGYSSLNYVRELPVDILKIDRSFLADTNPQVEQMTASIVELARIFNLKAVAEGVENPEQLSRLEGMRCDFGQGFHFARPLCADEVLEMATQQRVATAGRVARAAGAGGPAVGAPTDARRQ